MMVRRQFLFGGMIAAAGAAIGLPVFSRRAESAHEGNFPVSMSDAEWRAKLPPAAYDVLRREGTERAYTSPLNDEKRQGVFICAGCDNPVYSSAAKYDSRTGWPSFFEPVRAEAVGTSTDYVLVYPRTEVHCANCGGHLGHIFDDGPEPTGKRHCINGVAMGFAAGVAS